MQTPFEDKATLRAVEQYMRDHRWDGLINLGDFLDFRELSSFDRDNARLSKVGAIQNTYDAGNAILDRHVKLIREGNARGRIVLIEGNHEFRVQRHLDEHPEAEGMVEVPVGLKLKERRIEWVPFWSKGELFKLGNAYFGHGTHTGVHHAKKHADVMGTNFFYGHTHDIQSHSRENRGNDKTLEAASLGCLCRYDQSYMRGRPSRWQQGFGVMHMLPDGYFNLYTVRIFKNRFVSPEGKLYCG
jgi:hypothetical protein